MLLLAGLARHNVYVWERSESSSSTPGTQFEQLAAAAKRQNEEQERPHVVTTLQEKVKVGRTRGCWSCMTGAGCSSLDALQHRITAMIFPSTVDPSLHPARVHAIMSTWGKELYVRFVGSTTAKAKHPEICLMPPEDFRKTKSKAHRGD